MQVIRSLSEMQELSLSLKKNYRIGLAPTMGYLHDGHLSLIGLAKQHSQKVIATIFVNPTQFGPNEDFEKYPRDEAGDLKKLESAGSDFVFIPHPNEIYPKDFETKVQVGNLATELCGKSRPGHFNGVATIVLKLFQITAADVSVFGEKDFQQLRIIEQMVKDFNLPIRILPAPIYREASGLALSSRNAYLNEEEKSQASILNKMIVHIQNLISQGHQEVHFIKEKALSLLSQAPLAVLDYLEICDSIHLKPQNIVDNHSRIFIALKFGKTRLIDNASLEGNKK